MNTNRRLDGLAVDQRLTVRLILFVFKNFGLEDLEFFERFEFRLQF